MGIVTGFVFVVTVGIAMGLDDGLARTPPMGYRTWNDVQGNTDTKQVESVVNAITKPRLLPNGSTSSLLALGYARVGTDDGWQACKTGRVIPRNPPLPNNGTSFHDITGKPLVNASRFPDLKAMVDYGHARGVKMDFYMLNCICMDEYTIQADPAWAQKCYYGDAQLLIDAGFDGVKIDNCGDDQGLGYIGRTSYLNASHAKLLIENSNQGDGNPLFPHTNPAGPPRENPANGSSYCPYHMFRSGGDIGADFGNIFGKLQYMKPYLSPSTPISRPGCWAFPDMLEVGNFVGELNVTESRTHFGAWAVVSSPLMLSTDLSDDDRVDSIWPIISNEEAIKVNQEWYGHPGRLAAEGTSNGNQWQAWAKKGRENSQAVLLLNAGESPVNVTIRLQELGLPAKCDARCIWEHKDLGTVQDHWTILDLGPHDSRFVKFTASKS